MTAAPVAPSWPFGRWFRIPPRKVVPRTQCPGCAGGGDLNGLECHACDGRGWFDADNPPPKED